MPTAFSICLLYKETIVSQPNLVALEKFLRNIDEKGTTIWDDNENAMIDDYAGGNIDDAYYRGNSDGEIELARQILAEYFSPTDSKE